MKIDLTFLTRTEENNILELETNGLKLKYTLPSSENNSIYLSEGKGNDSAGYLKDKLAGRSYIDFSKDNIFTAEEESKLITLKAIESIPKEEDSYVLVPSVGLESKLGAAIDYVQVTGKGVETFKGKTYLDDLSYKVYKEVLKSFEIKVHLTDSTIPYNHIDLLM